ncbi:Mobile element protein [Candidatus Enterovibrio escicola]|uniref:Mobile element protein n=1 Tax=Candidatus Enterovibrio escicola TaxID=1927127 RepID=A0A2A5T751_9GAMM|nr:Mobile element protein [Candidatus Enterovibrio escacola]
MTTANVDDRKPVSARVDELWGVYTETKVISLVHWSGNLQTDKGVTLITGVKKHETQSDETLVPPDTPEMIYYSTRF